MNTVYSELAKYGRHIHYANGKPELADFSALSVKILAFLCASNLPHNMEFDCTPVIDLAQTNNSQLVINGSTPLAEFAVIAKDHKGLGFTFTVKSRNSKKINKNLRDRIVTAYGKALAKELPDMTGEYGRL